MIPATDRDEISITFFGPGYGESIVVHYGNEKWFVVDSCKFTRNGRSIPLAFLEHLKVDVASAVKLVLITHWHDDHIRGAAELVANCKGAMVAVPASFGRSSFATFLAAFEDPLSGSHGTGVDEISEIMKAISPGRLNGRPAPRLLASNKELIRSRNSDGDLVFSLLSLSPSDAQVLLSLRDIGALIPAVGATKRRATANGENHDSAVLWAEFGDRALFGADLEIHANFDCGWQAIVDSDISRTGASVFKVAHHGSQNGHHPNVWTNMLVEDAIAVVTPWQRNKGLPTDSDMQRLEGLTKNVFLTAQSKSPMKIKLDRGIEKTLKQNGVKLYSHSVSSGAITLTKPLSSSGPWCVSMWDANCLK